MINKNISFISFKISIDMFLFIIVTELLIIFRSLKVNIIDFYK